MSPEAALIAVGCSSCGRRPRGDDAGGGPVHCDHLARIDFGEKVVDGREDVPAAGGESGRHLARLTFDLLDRPERQGVLGIDAAPPQAEPPPAGSLPLRG
jgi:hypothetical protein